MILKIEFAAGINKKESSLTDESAALVSRHQGHRAACAVFGRFIVVFSNVSGYIGALLTNPLHHQTMISVKSRLREVALNNNTNSPFPF